MTDYAELCRINFLPELSAADIHEKTVILQTFLKEVIFDYSGLWYSLLLIDGERSVRMMTTEDIQSIDIWDVFPLVRQKSRLVVRGDEYAEYPS